MSLIKYEYPLLKQKVFSTGNVILIQREDRFPILMPLFNLFPVSEESKGVINRTQQLTAIFTFVSQLINTWKQKDETRKLITY